MQKYFSWIMGFLLVSLTFGCATVPQESVAVSRQIEKNLETLRQNNLILLDEWYNLSIDYWTDKVGEHGPDKIIEKAKAAGIPINLEKDYGDLVQQILKEYRNNFLAKLNQSYKTYRDGISEDYSITINGAQKLTIFLQSVVRVNEERAKLIESLSSELEVKDSIKNVQSQLQSGLQSP